jgi:hypothetical protein
MTRSHGGRWLARRPILTTAADAPTATFLRRGSSRGCSSLSCGQSVDPFPKQSRGIGEPIYEGSKRVPGQR